MAQLLMLMLMLNSNSDVDSSLNCMTEAAAAGLQISAPAYSLTANHSTAISRPSANSNRPKNGVGSERVRGYLSAGDGCVCLVVEQGP